MSAQDFARRGEQRVQRIESLAEYPFILFERLCRDARRQFHVHFPCRLNFGLVGLPSSAHLDGPEFQRDIYFSKRHRSLNPVFGGTRSEKLTVESNRSRRLWMLACENSQALALKIAPIAAAVSNYCDHVEHNETAESVWVIGGGESLASNALAFAKAAGHDLVQLYAARLASIESRNVLQEPNGFNGRDAALAATTWRELQLVQCEHDRWYHPDVVGLSRFEQ